MKRLKRCKWVSEWVREKERQRNKGFGQLYLTPYLFNPRFDSYFRAPLSSSLTWLIKATSQPEATCPQGHTQCCFSWLSSYPVGVETTCLNNIFNAHAFSFRISIDVLRFRCPPFFTRGNILFRNPQLTNVNK